MKATTFPAVLQIVRHLRLSWLGGLHWLLFGKSARPATAKPERIVIVRFSALGDFILAIPSIWKLRLSFPHAKILLLTAVSRQRAVQELTLRYTSTSHHHPWVDFVHPSLVDQVVSIGSLSLRSLYVHIAPHIVAFKPDLTLLLPQQNGGTVQSVTLKFLFLKLLGVRCPVLGWRSGNGPLFRKWLYRQDQVEHGVMAPLKAVNEANPVGTIDEADITFPLDIPRDDARWSSDVLSRAGCEGKDIVAIAPGSIQPHKQWPLRNFVALCQHLQRCHNVYLVIVGTGDTRESGNIITGALGGNALNLCGETSISKLAALLQRCTLMVGNDGGSMHLAAAVGCRCVSIMSGIEYPGSVEPWGNKAWSVRAQVDCAPCYSFTCCPKGHNKCLTSIGVNEVLRKCILALESIRHAAHGGQ
ncbi:MAG: glycosyltransferase family 9 protein [Verrucomicrobia bacterium]|nr:glycosyltransferase family 9 protein [Verrucomicrobiota bacterium]